MFCNMKSCYVSAADSLRRIAGQTDCKQYSNSQAKAIDTPAYVKKIEDTQT